MIKRLILRNAGPFRGEHVLELGPRAYALTGRWEADPGRSNWSGKSFLLEMVQFALTGHLPKPRAADYAARGWGAADGWISEGARDGVAELVLEDGASVRRERRRGKPTQVTFSSAAGTASQAEAEAAALRHVGFSDEDFRNVAYFEQGEMKRLIRTEPERRFDIVRGWLGLEKAEEAEDRAGKVAAEVVRELQRVRGRRDAVRAMLDAAAELPDEEKLRGLRDEVKEQMDRAAAAVQRRQDHGEATRAVAAFDAIVELGTRLAAELEKIPADAVARWVAAQDALGPVAGRRAEAESAAARKKRVAAGKFDGACPVLSGFECPARAAINASRAEAAAGFEEARAALEAAAREHEEAKSVAEDASRDAMARRAKEQELERLRERARAQQPEAKAARKLLRKNPAPAETAFDMAGMQRIHAEAVQAIAEAQARREHRERLGSELAALERALESAAADVAVAVASRNVFRATQRRVAERALDEIGGRAGAMMRESGIDLSVAVRWEREGKNPARACELCGAAFPASAKVKACPDCGAERGMNVVQKLEFVLSARSGAADDLAGVALQLAAGDWLLRARSSPWACAMLDEPLAACDKTNRRALAGQLIRLLGTGSFRQSIIVSHSPDIVDLYPGRIEVVVARDGSRRIAQS